ncbi:AAA family ATPase [Ilyobacter polytropus]|uniref:Transcriptional regulator, SARP family n=1 Tax=Ilyobacter polytropus (strain ATCC 51220 / DSM 2926 / LMG 16218 / CuHBu1) TaxID=572544 RepID=E3H6C5_ILYPC|nr:AAA family ATPase [Ilyobacter polytropus]ADO82338.1 transcriptional regulator, SARP family [Ilyobacter polytropus DSM 2926]
MKEMYFKIFGNPQIKVDNIVISPSLKRGEALLYYMVVNKRVCRDEIINLFWKDSEKKNARKNLRNLLYKLKQDLGFDLIISINRETLVLNPNIRISSDYNEFMEGIGEYEGSILEDFCDGIYMFSLWKEKLRKKVNYKFLDSILLQLKNNLKNQEFDIAEKLALKIIKIDSKNVRVYFDLMKIYDAKGEDEKVHNIYDKFKSDFDDLLDDNLREDVEKFYKDVFMEKADRVPRVKFDRESFFVRNKELNILKKEYEDFIQNDVKKIVMIHGEAGVGKTHLVNKFFKEVDNEEADIIYYDCSKDDSHKNFKLCKELFYQARECWSSGNVSLSKYFMRSGARIYSFLEKLDENTVLTKEEEDEKLKYIEKSMSQLFGEIKRKFIFVVDNIQWGDKASLFLLEKRIPFLKGKVMFISTVRDEGGPWVKDFLTICLNYDRVKKIDLKRFSTEETFEFIDKYSNNSVSSVVKESIYRESEGNPFFIVEYLENLGKDGTIKEIFTKNISAVLNGNLKGLSDDEYKLLKILSLFNIGLELDTLKKLYDFDKDKLREILRNLILSGIIKEKYGFDEVRYKFKHRKFKEFVYSIIETSEKKGLYKKIREKLGATQVQGEKSFLYSENTNSLI